MTAPALCAASPSPAKQKSSSRLRPVQPKPSPSQQKPSPRRRPAPREKPLQLPTVPVEQTRPGEAPEEKDASGFATVIKLRREAQRIRSLGDVLQQSAGVNVRSTGGPGAWSSISIRGSSPSQVQILLDGIPLNHGGSGSINLSDLPLDILGQAVIYRGFAPAHLGGAMGGVVSLQTHWPRAYRSFQSTLASGSFGTFKANLTWAQRKGPWQWLVFGHYLGSIGSFPYYDDRGTPLQVSDDLPQQIRQNNVSHTASTLARLMFRPTRKLALDLSHLLVYRDQGIPGIGNFRSLTANYRQLRNLVQISAKGKRLPWRAFRWSSQIYLVHLWEGFTDRDDEIGLGRQETDNHTLLLGWKAQGAWLPLPQWEISLSWQLRRESYTPRDLLQPQISPEERERWRFHPALQSLLSLWEDRLSLVVGGRIAVLHNAFADALSLPGSDAPATVVYPTGRVGLRLRPWDWLWFQTNAGRYVRLPTFWELFGDRGTTIGNPGLSPETGWMWDIGGVLHLKQRGILDELRIAYAFFLTQSTDLIRFVQNSQRTMIAVNIDAARTIGQEVRLRVGLLRWLRLAADFTWLDAINQSESSIEQGKQLPGRPRWELSLRADLVLRWGRLFYTYTGLGGNFLDRANLRELAPRYIHTIGLTLRPAEIVRSLGGRLPWTGLFVTFEIQNLLDSRVASVPLRPALPNLKEIPQALSDYSGYPLPGRAFYFTVNWKI